MSKNAEQLSSTEGSTNLCLSGEAKNCSLISATLENSDTASWTWRRWTSTKDNTIIEGVTGASYQTNADDIGCTLEVLANGFSAEIGPITLLEEINQSVKGLSQQPSVLFTLRDKSIQVEGNNITINRESKYTLDGNFPQLALEPTSATDFSLYFSDAVFSFEAENAFSRDLISIYIRSQSASRSDAFLRVQSLNSRLEGLDKSHQVLEKQFSSLVETDSSLLEQVTAAEQDMQGIYTDKERIDSEVRELSALHEELVTEVKFLKQDALIYKAQNSALENQCKSLKNENIDKYYVCEKCNGFEVSSRTSSLHSAESPEIYQQKIGKLKEKLSSLKISKQEMVSSMYEDLKKIEEEKAKNKERTESLTLENEKLLSKFGKNPKDQSELLKEKEEFETEKTRLLKELEDTQARANHYVSLLEVDKKKIETKLNLNFELKKQLNSKNGQYQKIINSLTQAISEKEDQIKVQRQLNEELSKQLSNLK